MAQSEFGGENDELDMLLADIENDVERVPTSSSVQTAPKLKEDESFARAFLQQEPASNTPDTALKEPSMIEKDVGDSSSDEDIANFLERKYNEYGQDINKKLKSNSIAKREDEVAREVNLKIKETDSNLFSKNKSRISSVAKKEPQNNKLDPSRSFKPLVMKTEPNKNNAGSSIYNDPIFGMRIVSPLLSSSVLIERMNGRKPVPMNNIQHHIQCNDLTQDWVIAGCILSKTPIKTSKKGSTYCIWKLSDLKGDMKTVSLFLFKNAQKELWKTATGMIIAVLNPSIFESHGDHKDIAVFSIDNPQKIMILGQSKDMGVCKAKKKNGENCTNTVNLSDCDFCVYHVKQEFGKMSKRSELQSSTSGRGLQELRNKVLGKNEVFYGGQTFTAVPAKKSYKLAAKDHDRMMKLSEYSNSPNAGNVNHTSKPKIASAVPYAPRDGLQSKVANFVETNNKQRLKDLQRLELLKEEEERFNNSLNMTTESVSPVVSSSISSPTSSTELNKSVINKSIEFSFLKKPTLNQENFTFDLNMDIKKATSAKVKALEILKSKPLTKSNPNFLKHRGTNEGKKRMIDKLNDDFNNVAKRQKLEEIRKEDERKTRIQKMIEAASRHSNLVDQRYTEEQNQYFEKLERKEALEEKMLNTFKVACKAVICLKCKYTAFSAADRCKLEKHPLKVIDAEKRFFQCEDCGNRTATVHKLPKVSCKTCSSSKWKRAAMVKERIRDTKELLSIRGDEETFIGSSNSSVNLNLLVPDE